jgi:predicted RNase H-like HicB family nuclease
MKEITFIVTEDEIDGGFNARAHWPDGNRDLFTDGDTREDLLRNIREAIDVSFDEGESKPDLIHLHFVRDEVIARCSCQGTFRAIGWSRGCGALGTK